jgi:hypothetical protein
MGFPPESTTYPARITGFDLYSGVCMSGHLNYLYSRDRQKSNTELLTLAEELSFNQTET